MTTSGWEAVASKIKKSITEQKSLLSQFPSDAASIITREIVFSLAVSSYLGSKVNSFVKSKNEKCFFNVAFFYCFSRPIVRVKSFFWRP